MPSDKRKETKRENLKDSFEIHPYKSLSEIEKQGSWDNSLTEKRFRISEVEGSGDIEAETFADKNINVMKKHKTKGKMYHYYYYYYKFYLLAVFHTSVS